MISHSTQIISLIRLNLARIMKGKLKFALLVVMAIDVILFYVNQKFSASAAASSSNGYPSPSAGMSYTAGVSLGAGVYLDTENLNQAQITSLNTSLSALNSYLPLMQTITKANFQNLTYLTSTSTSRGGGTGILLTFTQWTSQPFQYTMTLTSSSLSLTSLWFCITKADCRFGNSQMPTVVALKYLIDTALLNPAGQALYSTFNVYQYYSSGYGGASSGVSTNMYYDFYFIVLGLMVTGLMIEEKQKGLKFGLLMSGVRRSSYYIGVLFVPIFLATMYAILVIVFMIIMWGRSSANGPIILLTLVASYGYVAYFWVLSQFVTNSRTATMLITIWCIGGYVTSPLAASMSSNLPSSLILLLCINPRIGLSMYQEYSTLATSNSFTTVPIPSIAPSTTSIAIISVFWMLFWFAIAVYTDFLTISKDEMLPFHYPISCWFKKQVNEVVQAMDMKTQIEKNDQASLPDTEKVSVTNLTKIYDGASTRALSNVSMEFAKGEIFGLLGFNGAGKSTLINILVGILSPSQGNIKIFGIDAKTNRYEIAARTGICSQQDILYDTLTVYEHLLYFGMLLGVRGDLKTAIDSIVVDLDMSSMLETPTANLSGGQKRKLCVALAFIHDPDLVVLDEMSSGVDPENRRVIWEFLFKRKAGKAILLCTHFMDEADLVCQRKAILTLGTLVCIGTSEFLKTVYKTGYTLTVEKRGKEADLKVLEGWMQTKNVPVQTLRINDTIADYQIAAEQIGLLAELEKESQLKNLLHGYSIKENGLESIFSSKELIDEKTLRSTPEEQEKLLKYLSSFVEPSFLQKTIFYFSFEMQRTLGGYIDMIPRFSLSIICTIILWVVIQGSTATNIYDNSILMDSNFVNLLVPSGFVLQTANATVLAADSRYLLKDSTVSSTTVSMGLYSNPTSNSSGVIYFPGFYGAPFLALQTASPLSFSAVQTTFEFIEVQKNTGIDFIGTFAVCILLTQIFFDILIVLTDEIVESKEKIKFLLLASGVPLSSYWMVTFCRLFFVSLPFIIFVPSAMPTSNFSLTPGFIFMYILQPISMAPVIGTVFNKDDGRNICQAMRFLNVLILLVVIIAGPLLSWPDSTYNGFVGLMFGFNPWTPMAEVIVTFLTLLQVSVTVPSTSTMCVISLVYLIVFPLILLAIELQHNFIPKVPVPNGKVSPESNAGKEDYIVINHVIKRFGMGLFSKPKVAVNNLSMSVKKNELFALLGANGCGKTTTLSMLTAQQNPTSGSFHIDGHHVASEKLDVIKQIGYCPQFDDLLIPTMTVSAHLRLFCAMNGIEKAIAEEYIQLLLSAYGILSFTNVNCGNLSGGTKRKVSAAIATMLPRALVVLDEASTGLDPLARQKLWNTVSLLNKDRTTIMTTHYINETSFCDRIAVMAEGQLRGLDTEHNLAKAFAKGYRVFLHFKNDIGNFVEWARQNLFANGGEKCDIKVENVVGTTVVVADFKDFECSLGVLVARLSAMKKHDVLLDFTIGRMTLENVFLDLIKRDPLADSHPPQS